MSNKQRILVTGASGRTGGLVVDRLLARPDDFTVRVLVRMQDQAQAWEQRGVEAALGDVRDTATSWADSALRDVDIVISTMGGAPFRANNLWRVDYEGTQRLIAAAKVAGVDHYVFVSTMGLRRHRTLRHPLSVLFYPKLLAEDVVRRSGLDYTIIRPGGLVENADSGMRNTREQVADACIAALDRPEVRNHTWEMSADRRSESGADPIFGVAIDPDNP